jgi:hypothetical protein
MTMTLGTVLWVIYWLGFGYVPGRAYRFLDNAAWMAPSRWVLAVLAFLMGFLWPLVALVIAVMWMRERVR